MSQRFSYQIHCPRCGLETNYSEAKYLALVGPELKNLVDKGDNNPLLSLKIFHPAVVVQKHNVEIPCTECNLHHLATNAKRVVDNGNNSDDDSDADDDDPFTTAEDREVNAQVSTSMNQMLSSEIPGSPSSDSRQQRHSNNNQSEAAMLMRNAALLFHNGGDCGGGDKNETNNKIVNLSSQETDPLMVALDRVKIMNPSVDPGNFEIGTARLTYTFRWLVKPIHAFLRVFLFRSLEQYLLGSVSVFKQPRSSLGKSASTHSHYNNSNRFLNWFYTKVLPLTLAADAPFSLVIFGVITGLWTCSQILLHYFLYSNSNSATSSSSSSVSSPPRNWAEAMSSIMFLLSYISFFLGVLSIYFMIRTICRDPGFLIPNLKKAKILKIDGGAVPPEIAAKEFQDFLHRGDDGMNDDYDHDEVDGKNSERDHHCCKVDVEDSSSTTKRKQQQQGGGAFASNNNNSRSVLPGSKWCETCHIWRPPRASHCHLCNLCCKQSEIHCTAIGAHIGERNYFFYVAFVFFAYNACMVQIIQETLLFVLNVVIWKENRLSLMGWLFFIMLVGGSIMTLFWAGSMWNRQMQNLKTGLTTKERLKKEFKSAGVPDPLELLAANNRNNGGSYKQDVDRAVEFLMKPSPPSNFVLEDQDDQEEMTVTSAQ